jgi:hypothetical protein
LHNNKETNTLVIENNLRKDEKVDKSGEGDEDEEEDGDDELSKENEQQKVKLSAKRVLSKFWKQEFDYKKFLDRIMASKFNDYQLDYETTAIDSVQFDAV